MASFIKRFNEMFKEMAPEKKVAIFTHDMPDPDAIGAAVGIKYLLKEKYDLDSTIFYGGEISHPQNKTMVNVLNIVLSKADEFDRAKFDKIILADCTTEGSVNLSAADVVIDHHKAEEQTNALSWIEHVGSASTLVWELIEYLLYEGKEVHNIPEIPTEILTALSFGIRNDTDDLGTETTTERDFKAVQRLNPLVDRVKVQRIKKYPYPTYFLELEKVLNQEGNNKLESSYYVGTVGLISETKRDSIPVLADRMLRLEGVETTIIFGIVGDTLQASMRSQSAAIDVDVYCKNIFGKDRNGAPFGGGKQGSGAVKVPLGIFSIRNCSEELKSSSWEALKRLIFYKIETIMAGN